MILKAGLRFKPHFRFTKTSLGDGCKFSTESQKLNLKTEARQGQALGTGLLMAFSLSACTFSVMQLYCVYNKELDFFFFYGMECTFTLCTLVVFKVWGNTRLVLTDRPLKPVPLQ